MKKQLLFVIFCFLFNGFSSFGQTAVNTHESPAVVAKTPALSEISNKIKAKEAAIAAGSRSTGATQSTELKDLYTNYAAALTAQMKETSSEEELKELRQELRYAEKRKAELTTNR